MSNTKPTCSSAQLTAFLNDELLETDQGRFLKHLDDCPSCQKQLDKHSADQQWWLETSSFLSDDVFDSELKESLPSPLTKHHNDPVLHSAIPGVLDALQPSDDPRMLGRFGGYEVVGVVGCGGMGVVLKGYEPALNRYVAIKVLAPHLAMSGAARARFSREGQATASVVHPNVVSIHRVSESSGLPFLVMPYVAGESLQRRLDHSGSLPIEAVIRIGLQVCCGLAAAHAQGLVHRDVKPANILMEPDVDRIILTDFGLARAADDASMTRTGVLAGTPQYMSPEQARGERVDQRSDLFSLGSVLFTLCTGRPPFRSETSYAILRKITDEIPRPIQQLRPETPVWLIRLIERLHAKDPDDRFQTAHEVAELFEQCLAHLQQPDQRPLPISLQRSPVRYRSRFLWAGGSILALSAMIAAATYLVPNPENLSSASSQPEQTDAPARLDDSQKKETKTIAVPEILPDDDELSMSAIIGEIQELEGELSRVEDLLNEADTQHDTATESPSPSLEPLPSPQE
ncbi:Serine/threonine-protein kinase PrkC [Thalassoglobus neptunius]|uniref:non-specific serine/threonine protein kinase n=1 Tax=Thalassoglobus neptunius TaxID=1938619 RepID=A0A5C5WGL9_9PLAN|nr:serine/threonine-protein kinase [Thalassoglobus neptunius]TWT49928.1 Serine/threonine-protein kinase PrkC [Thalassoglobus neptunius]